MILPCILVRRQQKRKTAVLHFKDKIEQCRGESTTLGRGTFHGGKETGNFR
jgi:hypothetical protein